MFVIRDIITVVVLLLVLGALVRAFVRSTLKLRRDMPPEFVDAPATWPADKRAQEARIASAYWDSARGVVTDKYGLKHGHPPPVEPPPEFKVEPELVDPKAIAPESRARYWAKLREMWSSDNTWSTGYKWNTGWVIRPRSSGPRETIGYKRSADPVSISPFIGLLMASILLITLVAALTIHPVLQLRKDMPADFLPPPEAWITPSQADETKVAQAYWDCVKTTVQPKYGLRYDLPLPPTPPPEFNVTAVRADPAASSPETRARYWRRLRQVWYLESTWKTVYEWDLSRWKIF